VFLQDPLKDGGLVEVAGNLRPGAPPTTALAPEADGVHDEFVDFVPALGIDQRADLGLGLGAAGGGHVLHLRGELLRELVGDGFVHDEAVGCGARFTHVAQLRQHRSCDRGINDRRPRISRTGRCRRVPSRSAGRFRKRRIAAGGLPRWSRERELPQP
jgi:hypothetical protein